MPAGLSCALWRSPRHPSRSHLLAAWSSSSTTRKWVLANAGLIRIGRLVFPTLFGGQAELGVGGAAGSVASLSVFADEADEGDAILPEHFRVSFLAHSVGAPVREGPALKGRERFVGGTFKGKGER